jgi:hypothetical protein
VRGTNVFEATISLSKYWSMGTFDKENVAKSLKSFSGDIQNSLGEVRKLSTKSFKVLNEDFLHY